VVIIVRIVIIEGLRPRSAARHPKRVAKWKLLTVFPAGEDTTETERFHHPERKPPRAHGLPETLGAPQEEVIVSLSVALTAPPAVASGLVLVKPPGGVRVTVFDRVPVAEPAMVATTV
jgi:hypothetical protein